MKPQQDVQPRYMLSYDRKQRVATYIALLILLLVGCDSGSGQRPTNTVAASWETQREAAAAAAKKVDQDPMLYHIFAVPYSLTNTPFDNAVNWTKDAPLEVSFEYITTSGTRLTVTLADDDPVGTARTSEYSNDQFKRPWLKMREKRQLYEASFQTIQISPRESVQLTVTEALAEAAKRNMKIRPLVGTTLVDDPAEWNVDYQDVQRKVDFADLGSDFALVVNGATGDIVSRRTDPLYPFSPDDLTP